MSETAAIDKWIDDALSSTPIYDLHTHLYPPTFGKYMLWGVDELLNYHYLVAETLRLNPMPYERFWALDKSAQSELIWKTLFVERAPISESCRGVLTVLKELGLDVAKGSLSDHRAWFARQSPQRYVDLVFKTANLKAVVMTNDPFDLSEAEIWLNKPAIDPRFQAVLRIDPLLCGWPRVADLLTDMGYSVRQSLEGNSIGEIRRFLEDWIGRMRPMYVAASLSNAWQYPDDTHATRVLEEAIIPVCRERNLPLALMIGVRRQVNPSLKLAGDAVGKSSVGAFMRLCAAYPRNKFLVTMLSRENQHELAVAARKFRNLMLFGCWWFLNNPSLIEEITRMRMELLGTSFVPQHSDARVLDQVIYKWNHSRRIIGAVLKDKFADLAATGWRVDREQVQRTVEDYLGGNFERFLAWRPE